MVMSLMNVMLFAISFFTISSATICLNSNTTYSENNTVIYLNKFGYSGLLNAIPGLFFGTYFEIPYVYSLTQFPGSTTFNCPGARYKGFGTSTGFSYNNNFTLNAFYYINNIDNIYINKLETLNFPNCNIFGYTNYSLNCFQFPFNLTSYLSDDCSTVGNKMIRVPVLNSNYNISFTNMSYYKDFQPCQIDLNNCGQLIYPKFNNSCCYINETVYYKNITNFISNNDFYKFDINNQLCTIPFVWSYWQILVVVFAILLIILIGFLIIKLICSIPSVIKMV